jgi:hypothetical protein
MAEATAPTPGEVDDSTWISLPNPKSQIPKPKSQDSEAMEGNRRLSERYCVPRWTVWMMVLDDFDEFRGFLDEGFGAKCPRKNG